MVPKGQTASINRIFTDFERALGWSQHNTTTSVYQHKDGGAVTILTSATYEYILPFIFSNDI